MSDQANARVNPPTLCGICGLVYVTRFCGTCPNKPTDPAVKWECPNKPHVTGAIYVRAWNAGVVTAQAEARGIAAIANGGDE